MELFHGRARDGFGKNKKKLYECHKKIYAGILEVSKENVLFRRPP